MGQHHIDTLELPSSGDALFSACRTYRYSLERAWGHGDSDLALWVMLNPSAANETENDPTLRKVIGFTERLGLSRLRVVNLYALVSTERANLYRAEDPVGIENDAHVALAAREASRIIVAWGADPPHIERVRTVLAILRTNAKVALHCLGRTRGGDPRHPVRLSYDTELEVFYG